MVSRAQHEDMLEKFETFRTWFLQDIMDIGNKNTIIVLPIEGDLKPIYRDDPPAISSVPAAGLASLHLSPLLGAPELVVPSESTYSFLVPSQRACVFSSSSC